MNCWVSDRCIKRFDLLVAEYSIFDLTRNKVYVARENSYGLMATVINDKGIEEQYTSEYFRFYEGETI
jgi:hypothetical protein